jgi:hypothetical protein
VNVHGGHASSAALERDAEQAVVVDGIFEDGPAGVAGADSDAVKAIEGDDIALSGLGAADGPTGGGSSEWATHANAAIDIA